MKAVWENLDDDFGRPEEIAARCLKTLMELSIPARNEHVAFIILYDKFVEVQHHLQEVIQEYLLAEFHIIETVVKKLPRDIKNEFIKAKAQAEGDGGTNPATGAAWKRHKILAIFVEKQVTISR